ncbi:MAG: protein meaA [Caulobacter sp.]|nr:protein meaA [Caulobacter sp.]
MTQPFQHAPDAPWIFRTYAGHSTAAKSNALYRRNLAAGQTGLSVAFDLPTQTGYDADHILARGEVGKVGVPIGHLGDMRTLFEAIPLDRMNTSMTINAPAAWLLAMYVALADEQGADRGRLQGTTQNDLIKEYLSRGTYIFPPEPSLKLIGDMVAWCYRETPKWNPINVCSYHLQEAGATPEQELAYALATAISVLDTVRAGGQVPESDFEIVASRISFFVNAGVRFVTELCKMRSFTQLWDEILKDRYGVQDPKARRFRYGVQVNSLGLTEQQPENNPYRILLEALAVTLSKDARCRALQLPAWNEALGLPRPWDQQWSLRMQQVLAYETDLLEYEDLFAGSHVVEAKVGELKAGALAELARIDAMGGASAAIGYMKEQLVGSNATRFRGIETGEMTVVGVNRWTESEQSPLSAGEGAIETVDPKLEAEVVERLKAWRAARDQAAADAALAELKAAAAEGRNIMEPSIAAARGGQRRGPPRRSGGHRGGEGRGRAGVAGPRPHLELPGRQARPRRPQQRGRTDRHPGPRLRHGRHLRRHPLDPGGDRPPRPRGQQPRRRPLHPVGLAPRPGAGGRPPDAGRGPGRHPHRRRRHHPAGGCPGAEADGRAAGLHPQGLQADADHGRRRQGGGGKSAGARMMAP